MQHLPASNEASRSPARKGRCRTSLNFKSRSIYLPKAVTQACRAARQRQASVVWVQSGGEVFDLTADVRSLDWYRTERRTTLGRECGGHTSPLQELRRLEERQSHDAAVAAVNVFDPARQRALNGVGSGLAEGLAAGDVVCNHLRR